MTDAQSNEISFQCVSPTGKSYYRQVEIYHQGREKEILENPTTLSGEDILPGFVLNLLLIW